MNRLPSVIGILALVLSVSGSFLDVIPSNGISEGDTVVIQCSEIFPYGVQSNSRLILRQNSSDFTQSAIWKLSRNQLSYSYLWSLPRTLVKSIVFNSVYTLRYKFVASYKHNRMEIQCLSSRTSLNRTPKKIIFVRKLPEILNCVTNPSQVIAKRHIMLRCWIVLGSPRASTIYVSSNDSGVRVGRARREYQTETKFSYRISLMSWMISPARYDDDLSFHLNLDNGIGNNSKSFQLKAKHKRKKVEKVTFVKDPTARLVVTPRLLPGQNLHENDIITCKVANATEDWKVKLVVKFAISNITQNVTSQTSSVEYIVPKRAVGNFLSYTCIADFTSKGIPSMNEEALAKWVFPANHRSFLNFYPQIKVFPQDSNVKATCVFLPGTRGYPKMTLTILSSNDQVRMKAVYNGTVDLLVSQNEDRYPVPKCRSGSNLFSCQITLVSIKADDLGAKVRCETKTNDRKDILEKRINMTVAPEIGMLTPSPVILANENETVTTTCLVRLGYPAASKYSLDFNIRNDNVVKENDPEIKDMNGFKWIVLRTSKKMSAQDQGGMIKCQASNDVKTVSNRSMIVIRLPVNNVTITPSSNDTLKRNQPFVCEAHGYPAPKVSLTGTIRGRRFVGTQGMMRIFSQKSYYTALIYPGDEIIVRCMATNTVNGEVYMASKTVKYQSDLL